MNSNLEDVQDGMFAERSLTSHELTAQFQSDLRELGESPVELADRIINLETTVLTTRSYEDSSACILEKLVCQARYERF